MEGGWTKIPKIRVGWDKQFVAEKKNGSFTMLRMEGKGSRVKKES